MLNCRDLSCDFASVTGGSLAVSAAPTLAEAARSRIPIAKQKACTHRALRIIAPVTPRGEDGFRRYLNKSKQKGRLGESTKSEALNPKQIRILKFKCSKRPGRHAVLNFITSCFE